MEFVKKILTLLFCFFYLSSAIAQKFTASVSKNKVAVGETFQIEFSVNTNASKFTPPNLNDFNVLGGPNQSQSMSFVNGQMSSSISYSYFLSPKKEGIYNVGPASIIADGKTIQSNTLKIEVVKSSATATPNQPQRSGRQQQQSAAVGNISDNVFLKCSINKSNVYVGEEIIATFKLYTRVNIVGTQASEMPKFNGFWSEELKDVNNQYTESVDGIQYTVAEIKKTILFPQRAGKLEIEPLNIKVVVRQRVQSNNIFDQMFGGSVRDVPIDISSNKVMLSVKPLPDPKPQGFSGITGKLAMSAKLNRNKVNVNESVTFKVTIIGNGNMKLIEAPKPEFPSDLESYDPKVSDKINVNNNGINGSRTFEYLIIPRTSGNFTIPTFEVSYFDASTKNYKILRSDPLEITVAKGKGDNETNQVFNSSVNKKNIKVIGNDIRFIHKTANISKNKSYFFNSVLYYFIITILIIGYLLFLIINRFITNKNKDVIGLKSRKATAQAVKRLSLAQKFMNENNAGQFYAEIIRALHGYICDKYNIAPSEISSDKIKTVLTEKGKKVEVINQFISILNDSEFARFSPSANSSMQSTYDQAVEVIQNIEI